MQLVSTPAMRCYFCARYVLRNRTCAFHADSTQRRARHNPIHIVALHFYPAMAFIDLSECAKSPENTTSNLQAAQRHLRKAAALLDDTRIRSTQMETSEPGREGRASIVALATITSSDGALEAPSTISGAQELEGDARSNKQSMNGSSCLEGPSPYHTKEVLEERKVMDMLSAAPGLPIDECAAAAARVAAQKRHHQHVSEMTFQLQKHMKYVNMLLSPGSFQGHYTIRRGIDKELRSKTSAFTSQPHASSAHSRLATPSQRASTPDINVSFSQPVL